MPQILYRYIFFYSDEGNYSKCYDELDERLRELNCIFFGYILVKAAN